MNKSRIYVCAECGLEYAEKNTAVKCEVLCKKNHSCNMEITHKSLNKQELIK